MMNKIILVGIVAMFATSLSAADHRPNIIYIMADDLGYGDLSCFGQTKFKTPNIDRLAAEGVTFTDYYAGSTVCALLEELGIDDNTIVSFTSDNGPHMEGGHDPKFFDSNGPLRGHKRDLYEGGIRVPFVARWPGRIKPGTKTDLPVAMWDVMPTCLEIAGAEAPAGIDGISYLPALLGQMDRQKKHQYLYWAFYERGGKQAVRLGQMERRPQQRQQGSELAFGTLRSDGGRRRDNQHCRPASGQEQRNR